MNIPWSYIFFWSNCCLALQVNQCQTFLFLHRVTHNMTTDCSLHYQFSACKFQAQNALRTCCVHKLFFVFVLTFRTIYVQNMFWERSELGIFINWTGNSTDNLLSYCWLVDARIPKCFWKRSTWTNSFWEIWMKYAYFSYPSFFLGSLEGLYISLVWNGIYNLKT